MYSMTMHILGGLVDAAMNSTTFGCLSAVITRTCAPPIARQETQTNKHNENAGRKTT